jgi:hypothetical protein
LPEVQRRDFYVYVDEFQNFTTLSVANMIVELRKYGVGLILANQYLHQLESDIRYAVLGNAGTLISFRLGAKDASFIAKEFQPNFKDIDLMTLPNPYLPQTHDRRRTVKTVQCGNDWAGGSCKWFAVTKIG